MMTDHTEHMDDVGAYVLGAMHDVERRAFERHLATCEDCREEVERLRVAADALPASVEQLPPPPGLKASLMEIVEGEARGAKVSALPRRRPARRLLAVAAVLLLGLVAGVAVSQLGGEDVRTVAATVDEAMPRAGGELRIEGDDATLELHDMPALEGERVYQVWLQHDDRMVPAQTFDVGPGGRGDVQLRDVGEADGVYVTREPRGGADVPSEAPIVTVPL